MNTTDRPHVVLIHCHDLGDWLSCYGNSSVPSPHLQALADQSIVFDQAFATAPLCTPARSSLFTGLLPHQNGLMGLTHSGWRYRDGVATLPEVMREHGYRSALIGFQHEDVDPTVLGFDEVHGLGFLPRALEVAHRVDWWLAQADPEVPTLLTIGMWEVHRPWPEEDYEPADPEGVQVPPYLPDNALTRKDIAMFHGAIRQLDEAVGRILHSLEASEFGRNAVLIFTTDHGVAFPRAKSTLYDSGVKVSLIVRPPAAWNTSPARVPALVSHLDILPTLVELAGGELSGAREGESLVPHLRDPDAAPGNEDRVLYLEKTYHDRYDPMRGVRTFEAKYIRNYADLPMYPLAIDLEESLTRQGMGEVPHQLRPDEELYLIRDDPAELRDVATDPGQDGLIRRMRELLRTEMERTSDPIQDGDIASPRPRRRDQSR